QSHRTANALSGANRTPWIRQKAGQQNNSNDVKINPKKWITVQSCSSLMDSNGKLLHIPIKLEMDICRDEKDERERITSLIRRFGEILRKESTKLGIDVLCVEDVQYLSEGRRCLLPLEVTCADWQSRLTQFAYAFFSSIQALELSEHPTITSNSLSLFPLRLLSDHNAALPLARVQFGSILSGGYCGLHWIMTAGRNGREGLYCSFDYNGKWIEVEYNCLERPEINEEEEMEVKGRIAIDMKTIQRICLDQKEERTFLCFYFVNYDFMNIFRQWKLQNLPSFAPCNSS
ncbi:hypothetical protein PMAYCL1PPCAC_32052, partial [Pristionchus mayeri]